MSITTLPQEILDCIILKSLSIPATTALNCSLYVKKYVKETVAREFAVQVLRFLSSHFWDYPEVEQFVFPEPLKELGQGTNLLPEFSISSFIKEPEKGLLFEIQFRYPSHILYCYAGNKGELSETFIRDELGYLEDTLRAYGYNFFIRDVHSRYELLIGFP